MSIMIHKRSLIGPLLVTLSLAALASCGIWPSSGVPATNAMPTPIVLAPTETLDMAESLDTFQSTLEQIYIQVSPSVVMIKGDLSQAPPSYCELPTVVPEPQLQGQLMKKQQSVGSGFVWDTRGHIVTNWHVISGCDQISVTFSDGTIVRAILVGTDLDSDLAVVHVDVPAEALRPVVLGDSTAVRAGQVAIALGSPFGKKNTMTAGIISAVGRSLPVEVGSSTVETIPGVLQTDTALNPGNSGGVLVNDWGQLIGVPTAIDSPSGTSMGVGYAIPSALVRQVIPDLISTGHHVHPWLGISGTALTPALAQRIGLSRSQHGALVTEVLSGSPADAAGLRRNNRQLTAEGLLAQVDGDVIVAIDGHPVLDSDSLLSYLAQSTKVGQTITLTLFRQGQQISVDVMLTGKPSIQSHGS